MIFNEKNRYTVIVPQHLFIIHSRRDGSSPDDSTLSVLSGVSSDNPQFVVSTGNHLYVYTQTDHADSRRGYKIRYYEGEFLL